MTKETFLEPHVVYPGRDLEAMSFAVNYHRWIFQVFRPYLGKRLVEVGAGSGGFSKLLSEMPLDSLTLLEPSREMYERLEAQIKQFQIAATLHKYNSVFRKVAAEIKDEIRPDSIVYVNVMEHIDDDVEELKAIYDTLVPGGRVCIFVPALPWLYGSYDELIGHHRRYTKHELNLKVQRAGFTVKKIGYTDFTGIAPWWIKYRLLRSNQMEPYAVMLYDKAAVPIIKILETIIPPPIGKNLFLIAEK